MGSPDATPDAFASDLQAERRALRSFVDLLRKEQEALVRGATDEVGSQVEAKARLLFELSRLASRRSRRLQEQDLAPNRSGMEAWFATNPEAGSLVPEWRELLRLTRTAYEVNQINGTLIEARVRANQQALAALHGAARISNVYGPDGRARLLGTARMLGAA